jgi:hypothetical protein
MSRNSIEIVLVDSNRSFLEALEFDLQHFLKISVKISCFQTAGEFLKSSISNPDVVVFDDVFNPLKTEAAALTQLFAGLKKLNSKITIVLLSEVLFKESTPETISLKAVDFAANNDFFIKKVNAAVRISIQNVLAQRKIRSLKSVVWIVIAAGLFFSALLVWHFTNHN